MTTSTDLTTGPLGKTGLEITRVGLGAWAIGGPWQFGWGPQDDEDSVRTIHHAVERGVNWIDTAPAYGLGHAEEVVGRAVRELPEDQRPYIFTKCGLVWEEGSTTVKEVGAPDSIRRECDASLRRLGVDVIDLLQIHWPPEDGTSVEDAWSAVVGLVDEGKARFAGVSNFSVEQLEACEAIRHVDTLQPPLSLINRAAAADVLPWCAEHGTGVIVYSPMQSGLLTGKFTRERVEELDPGDWRRGSEWFRSPRLEQNLDLVAKLSEIASALGCTVGELAIAWTLAWPAVSGAIVGARTPEQVDGWVRAGEIQLDDEVLDQIAAAVEETGAGVGPMRPPSSG
jgi:aryl-alcohol dehydrogenase-like predicted oxidoreductase